MIRALLIWLALALPVAAQELPEWQHTSINDFAGLLTPADTQKLDQALIDLFEDTDIEGTIVTLSDRASYGGLDGLEAFATRLFNHWGVGDAARNDGFMVLVLDKDREARIELGAGYSPEADILAQDIMRNVILPKFRDGQMSQGITEGTQAVIDRIARPVSAGQALEKPGKRTPLVPVLAAFAIVGAVVLRIGRSLVRQFTRSGNKCPNCGGAGMIEEAAPEVTGTDSQGNPIRQTFWTRCPNCGYRQQRTRSGNSYRTTRRSRGGGGFGGGRSSGGGASGRW